MGPKTLLRQFFARRKSSHPTKHYGWLGDRLHDPNLWHFGRRTVAGGVGLGLFLAFIPIPIQMLIAVPAAILMRVNLPVTIVSLWVSNPITFAPFFVFAFKVGALLTGQPNEIADLAFDPSFDGFIGKLGEIWWPLVVGCFTCGISAAAIGNLTVRWVWYLYLVRLRKKRLREAAQNRKLKSA